MNTFRLGDEQLVAVSDIVSWYREAQADPRSRVLPHPKKERWREFDEDRLWCDIFFTVAVKGGSRVARDYMQSIEDGTATFELKVSQLRALEPEARMPAIRAFGRGENRLGKALGRFFSLPENFGQDNSYERVCADFFEAFKSRGFTDWLYAIDALVDERQKAMTLELVPGINLKASRDFLNGLGMTTTLVALDVRVLRELKEKWGWNVPLQTPSHDRGLYEAIEDGVRDVAERIGVTVV